MFVVFHPCASVPISKICLSPLCRSHWVAWWRFAPGLLLTSVVGVLIVVFDAHAPVPFMKLCLYLLRYLLTMAYFCLHEIHSSLIISLPLVCVRNNSTLVAAS